MNWTSLTEELAPLDLRSCLISRRGELVFERYRNPGDGSEIADTHSVTKSFLSALVCIAMDRELLPGPDTLASEFFPRLGVDEDPRKRSITLEHLLTMSAGFEWTEFGGRNSFPKMTRSPRWADFVLELPLMDKPGDRMTYNSGISQLLSSLLSRAVGMTAARFAEEELFGPLGIGSYEWESDPQGVNTGGFGLHLRPADLLKFGQLYLQQGRWGDRQLVSAGLAERSVRPALRSRDHREGWYGWHWWSDRYSGEESSASVGSSAAAMDYFFARGYGGQFIYVVPSRDAVVVLTNDKRKKDRMPVSVFRELIAPRLFPEP
ncbi:serine hydrolase [Cohnella sp. AR92]|uniref:serine hydrolase domain-containing protein n=1 Tax=Cohnella sp. AR92 TaxID=648716 RepID=UPI000F8CBD16|nr:serine hydrolase [Cohnella sp. AR92]RUS47773.1 class C beta-lactamase-related serine hydrolase [Cohnella sp. AR92]